jgi:hypothetical protein
MPPQILHMVEEVHFPAGVNVSALKEILYYAHKLSGTIKIAYLYT